MGDGGEDTDEDGSDSASICDDVQGGGSDSDTLWEKNLGSDGGNVEGAGGVPSSGGPEDSRDVRSEVAEALEDAVLYPIKDYIQRRQATIAEYIANLLIY